MSRELTPQEIAERSLIKTYRKSIWNPFIAAVKRYELIEPGGKIAVCISGGKDSVALAQADAGASASLPPSPLNWSSW